MTQPILTQSLTEDAATNANLAWADSFVGALAAAGLTDVCIAPGSRSTPLTLAFARQAAIKTHLHLDERSGAFFALGLAMATARPVALVCTSGTAAAEFHPAAIEAYQSQVPLLLLTADRPHEMRYSGANQTIDQVKMFGDHVLWAFDVALPEAEPSAVVQRSLQSLAARACHIANGVVKGPVHLNFPFRKPLEPDAAPLPAPVHPARSTVQIERGRVTASPEQVAALTTLVQQHERGLIVCGPGRATPEFARAVVALAKATGYPILADPLAGLRFGAAAESGLVLGGYESYLRGGTPPWGGADLVLRFGAVPTSKWLNSYLEQEPPAHVVHVRANGIWADDLHLVTHFLQAEPAAVCEQLAAAIANRKRTDSAEPANGAWLQRWLAAEARARQLVHDYCDAHFFDGAAVRTVLDALPRGARLMVGNSLPVRHLDQFGLPTACPITVYGNRGASGIDGVTSTALGIAAASAEPLVLITGDITFYHDMNGLLALRQAQLGHVSIVLLNNDGGSIFRRLPVAKFDPPFTDLFLTPHGLDFRHVATLYGIDYGHATNQADLQEQMVRSLRVQQPSLIEVQTDGAADLQHQRRLAARIVDAVAQLDFAVDNPN